MIYINDKAYSLGESKTLVDLFKQLNISLENGMALAVNNKVIPKSSWKNQAIYPNDKILLIKASQGG
jgi:sulfur carrier protein